ncbi:hypothetical protein U1Q18_010240 [Sarracenia purpurea var. burkii]
MFFYGQFLSTAPETYDFSKAEEGFTEYRSTRWSGRPYRCPLAEVIDAEREFVARPYVFTVERGGVVEWRLREHNSLEEILEEDHGFFQSFCEQAIEIETNQDPLLDRSVREVQAMQPTLRITNTAIVSSKRAMSSSDDGQKRRKIVLHGKSECGGRIAALSRKQSKVEMQFLYTYRMREMMKILEIESVP